MMHSYIRGLNEISTEDKANVGGKAYALSEMIALSETLGISVPPGFVITVDTYRQFMENDGKFTPDMEDEIRNAYLVLGNDAEVDVAVRSSSTAEDCPDSSFAGQYDTYLNVRGIENVLESIKMCFASVFNERAILYRKTRGYDTDPGIAVVVQRMARSDLGSAGVAFSICPETGFDKVVVINGSYGLGEMVVQGEVVPDEFIYFKPTSTLIASTIGKKDRKMIYSSLSSDSNEKIGGSDVEIVNVDEEKYRKFCITKETAVLLSEWVVSLEKHYLRPVDVEWAYDGNQLYLVQVRPETIHSKNVGSSNLKQFKIDSTGHVPIASGIAVGQGVSSGKIRKIDAYHSGVEFTKGDILVAPNTTPDWEPIMVLSSAIITYTGGRTCHAAIIARELGIPALVGCCDPDNNITDGGVITLSCAEGERGFIYSGAVPFEVEEINLAEIRRQMEALPVKVCLNIGNPDIAFKYASFPNYGIGLARMEFIITSSIKIHPKALIDFDSISKDREFDDIESSISEMISGYPSGKEYFITKLAEGISKICASVYPNQVILRFSDFKTNEYRGLIGGDKYEPIEENPMIGWRGASRYYSPLYEDAFSLECEAIKRVRNQMKLTNLDVMIPFCRTVEELHKVLFVMKKYGLKRAHAIDENDIELPIRVFLMAEIPSNIILASEFSQHIDGFSVGSNDLTSSIISCDRDNAQIASIGDERNDAVKKMILKLLKVCKRTGTYVGICGSSVSDFPEYAVFLMNNGINAMSVTPDALGRTINALYYCIQGK